MNTYYVEVELSGESLGFSLAVITPPDLGYRLYTPSTAIENDTALAIVFWPQYADIGHLEACVAEGSRERIHEAVLEYVTNSGEVRH